MELSRYHLGAGDGGVDPDPANKDKIVNWARDDWTDLCPYSAGGAYVNFMMDEGEDRVRATYRENYDRLSTIKAKYDPDNFFRMKLRPDCRENPCSNFTSAKCNSLICAFYSLFRLRRIVPAGASIPRCICELRGMLAQFTIQNLRNSL